MVNNTVHKSIIVQKLKALGPVHYFYPGLLLALINRFQAVKLLFHTLDDFKLSPRSPNSSHLGPLLFLLFINDFPELFDGTVLWYFADDINYFAQLLNSSPDPEVIQNY